MKKTKMEKGITLVALIITIVVLLILAVVAISSIQNDGILGQTQNAAGKYNQSVRDEQGLLGYYQGYLEYGGISQEEYEELEVVKRYVLGENKAGKAYTDIFDEETGGFLDDEETTNVDESVLYTLLNMRIDINIIKGYIYAKYNNRAYRISIDLVTGITESVKLVYTPEGREGTTVVYDSNLDGTDENWIIITDRGGKVEIVSENAMGSLTLGEGDISVTATTDLSGDNIVDNTDIAILSYNNAITTINNYCKEIVTATDNAGVRSVGGTNNNATPYSSINFDSWFKGSVDVASRDIQYEEDFVKMSYWGILGTETEYWVASRLVVENEGDVTFGAESENGNVGNLDGYNLWYVNSDNSIDSNSVNLAVRPVVINPSGI